MQPNTYKLFFTNPSFRFYPKLSSGVTKLRLLSMILKYSSISLYFRRTLLGVLKVPETLNIPKITHRIEKQEHTCLIFF